MFCFNFQLTSCQGLLKKLCPQWPGLPTKATICMWEPIYRPSRWPMISSAIFSWPGPLVNQKMQPPIKEIQWRHITAACFPWLTPNIIVLSRKTFLTCFLLHWTDSRLFVRWEVVLLFSDPHIFSWPSQGHIKDVLQTEHINTSICIPIQHCLQYFPSRLDDCCHLLVIWNQPPQRASIHIASPKTASQCVLPLENAPCFT